MPRSRLLIAGGALLAVGAAAYANRRQVAGLLGVRSGAPEPPPYSPPQPSPAPVAAPQPSPAPGAVPVASDTVVKETLPASLAASTAPEPSGTPAPQGDPILEEAAPEPRARPEPDATSWETWSGRSAGS